MRDRICAITHPTARPIAHPPSRRDGEGRERPRPRQRAPDRGRDGDSVDRQRRRVVEQALSFEERHDPSRHGEPRDDGGGRDLVGRRDDRAERQRDGPRDAGNQRVRDDGHRSRGRDDQADREGGDIAQVRAQAAQRREEGRRVEDRREDEEEDEVRLDVGPRQARHEPEQQAADDQEDRVGDPEAARDRDERGNRDEQRQDEFGASHATARLFRIAWRRRREPSGPGQRSRMAGMTCRPIRPKDSSIWTWSPVMWRTITCSKPIARYSLSCCTTVAGPPTSSVSRPVPR